MCQALNKFRLLYIITQDASNQTKYYHFQKQIKLNMNNSQNISYQAGQAKGQAQVKIIALVIYFRIKKPLRVCLV